MIEMRNTQHNSLNRRQLIKVGVLGAGLGLSDYFRAAHASQQSPTERSAVLVFLKGGPSHQDTFDLKPDAPAEYRGNFVRYVPMLLV